MEELKIKGQNMKATGELCDRLSWESAERNIKHTMASRQQSLLYSKQTIWVHINQPGKNYLVCVFEWPRRTR